MNENLTKNDAVKFLNYLVKSFKLRDIQLTSLQDLEIGVLVNRKFLQMRGLIKWCELLDMPYEREDWEGNAQCESDWDIVWFVFKDIKFFELVEKEK